MEDIILIGGGGHCRSCIDVIETQGKFRIAGIVDLPSKVGERVLSYPIIGTDADLGALSEKYRNFHITIGHLRSPANRISLYKRLKALAVNFPQLISPNTHISKHAVIGEGTVIMHGVIVNAAAKIGSNCILNSHALIEHDAVVGDHCHISTGAIINGGVVVGSGSFIGSGCVTKQYTVIPDHSFVQAHTFRQ
jgi:sugar O-acyltransferase (sialic acid O-acetyltransferase NeuD family)